MNIIICKRCGAKYNRETTDICPICNEKKKYESKYYGLRKVKKKKLNFVQVLAYNIFKRYGTIRTLTDEEKEWQLKDLEELSEVWEMFGIYPQAVSN